MPNIKRFCFNLFREHCTVIWKDSLQALVIDPGMFSDKEREEFSDFITSEGLELGAVLLTHGHPDHMFSAKFVQQKYGVKIYMSPDDKVDEILEISRDISKITGIAEADFDFETEDISDGEILDICGFKLEVIATPGHTPGSVCYLDRENRLLYTGDTLMAGTIGRTDLKGGDYDKEIVSIMEKLMFLDGDIRVLPGHGSTSTIADERTENPFLQPFNEPEDCIVEEN